MVKNDDCYYIFHAIAPVYSDVAKDSCTTLLKQSVVTCLETAQTLGLESISMPLISHDDDFGFPTKQVTES